MEGLVVADEQSKVDVSVPAGRLRFVTAKLVAAVVPSFDFGASSVESCRLGPSHSPDWFEKFPVPRIPLRESCCILVESFAAAVVEEDAFPFPCQRVVVVVVDLPDFPYQIHQGRWTFFLLWTTY